MTEFNEKDHTWIRKCFSREKLLTMTEYDFPRFPIMITKLFTKKEISEATFRDAKKQFIRKMNCFPFRVVRRGKMNEFWLAKIKKMYSSVYKIKKPYKMSHIIEDLLCSGEDALDFRIIYRPLKKRSLKKDKTVEVYCYDLLVSFHTGTYDEFSCALIFNMFLEVLDACIKGLEIGNFSKYDLYDHGLYIEEGIVMEKNLIENADSLKQKLVNGYLQFLQTEAASFKFPTTGEEDYLPMYMCRRISLNRSSSFDLLCICKETNTSVYATIFSAINYAILYCFRDCGFEGEEVKINVMHKVNTKFAFQPVTIKNLAKLGFHFIPIMHQVPVEAYGYKDILKNAQELENMLMNFIPEKELCGQEALRQLIEEMSNDSLEDVIPKCLYSLTNLGSLEEVVRHKRNNFVVGSISRANACHPWSLIDFTFYTSRKKLIICADYCSERIADVDVEHILDILHTALESLL